MVERTGGGWSNPMNVEGVNSEGSDSLPFLNLDMDELWFTRWHQGAPAVFRLGSILRLRLRTRNLDMSPRAPIPALLSPFRNVFKTPEDHVGVAPLVVIPEQHSCVAVCAPSPAIVDGE